METSKLNIHRLLFNFSWKNANLDLYVASVEDQIM